MAIRISIPVCILVWLFICAANAGESTHNIGPARIDSLQPGRSTTDWRSRFEALPLRIDGDAPEPQPKPILPWRREQPFYWDGATPRQSRELPVILPRRSRLERFPLPKVLRERSNPAEE